DLRSASRSSCLGPLDDPLAKIVLAVWSANDLSHPPTGQDHPGPSGLPAPIGTLDANDGPAPRRPSGAFRAGRRLVVALARLALRRSVRFTEAGRSFESLTFVATGDDVHVDPGRRRRSRHLPDRRSPTHQLLKPAALTGANDD